MKAVLSIVFAAILGATATADTVVTDDITTDTTWDVAGSPYIINHNVQVLSASTLTIQPGVTVKLDSLSTLRTNTGGSIVAVGSEGNEILFTSGADSPAPNDWWGVCPWQPSSSVFSHCVFEYGRYNLYSDHSSPAISYCVSRYADQSGFFCEDASPTITGCTATDNPDGISVYDGSPVITSCNLTGNTTGIYVSGPDANPVIHDCNIYDNSSVNMYVRGYTEGFLTIDAENNWWGVDSYLDIGATIVVGPSYAPYVEVDYDPWLHEVPVEAASWARVKAMYR